MVNEVDNCQYDRDVDGEIVWTYADEVEVYDTTASVVYPDDTYDNFEIFEVEV